MMFCNESKESANNETGKTVKVENKKSTKMRIEMRKPRETNTNEPYCV